jgi:hypothetical protein
MEQKENESKEQKDFESKLDEYANKISTAVGEGVRRVEEAFEKGKESLKTGEGEGGEGVKRMKGSPKTGLILVGFGIVWLLYIAGLFQQPVFPILLIILGLYFLIRNR